MSKSYKQTCQEILNQAGIQINGDKSWDMQVHNPKTYKRILSQGSLGLGESYMDGWWDCKALDQFFYKVLSANLDSKVKGRNLWNVIKAKLTNPQKLTRTFNIGKKHYDVGNDLFELMLDKRMVYSCGYWKNSNDVDKAQESKLKLTCKKMNLKPGMTILDIGCGWGSFLKYAAEKHKIRGVGVTVSKKQVELANQLCSKFPVDIILQDYRKINKKFDRVVSIGMFEHVGPKNHRTYIQKVHNSLTDNGIFLLHTIGRNTPGETDPWISKYIFPGGALHHQVR